MTDSPRVPAVSGGARNESLDKRLIRLAGDAVEAAGGSCTVIDRRDFPLPIYDGDLEAFEGPTREFAALVQRWSD